MSINEIQSEIYNRACMGRPEAAAFLGKWAKYVHAIDDLVDEKTNGEFRVLCFMLAFDLYNDPFYLAHREQINPSILTITNLYADSVAWEKSEGWQLAFSEFARHFGAEMVLTVAAIVGGYSHMRLISPEIRSFHWSKHHGEKGNDTVTQSGGFLIKETKDSKPYVHEWGY